MSAPNFDPRILGQQKETEPSFQDLLQSARTFSGGIDEAVNFAKTLGPDSPLIKYRPPSEKSDLRLFAESAWSAGTGELFGSTPDRDIERFRTENPIGGVASVLAGVAPFFIAPALGPVRALSAGLPGFTRALAAADKLQKTGHLFKAGAVRDATIFAPLEAGRVVGSIFNPEEGSFGRTVKSAGSELAFIGGIGGTLGALGPRLKHFRSSRLRGENPGEEAARELRVARHIGQEFDRSASDQSKWELMGQWEKLIAESGQAEASQILPEIQILKAGYESRIKLGPPPRNPGKDTTRFVAWTGDGARTKRIESLYDAGVVGARGARGILSRVFKKNAEGETGGFATQEFADLAENGFMSLAKELGIQDTWLGFTQYPRQLIPTNKTAEDRLLAILRSDFRKVGENQWLQREASEGLYIGVRRIPPEPRGSTISRARERLNPASGQFFIFKTNKPSQWFKGASEVYDTNADVFLRNAQKWGRQAKVLDNEVPVLKGVERDAEFFDANLASLHTGKTRHSTNPNTSAEVGYLRNQINRYLPQSAREALDPAVESLSEIANSLRIPTAPARLQFSKNPRANNLVLWAKKTFDDAHQRANEILLGPIKKEFMEGGKSPLGQIVRTAINPSVLRREGGTQKLFRDTLKFDGSPQHRDFAAIWEEGLTAEQAAARNLHPEAQRLANELDRIDKIYTDQFAAQAKALGTDINFIPKKRHFGIARTWEGAFRAPIMEAETSEIVGYGSGFTKQQAAERANQVARAINKEDGRKTLQLYGERPGKDVDRLIGDDVWTAGTKEIEKKLRQLERRRSKSPVPTGLPTDLGPQQADVFGFATEINLGNPMVDRILKTRSTLLRSEPLTFKKRFGALGAVGTKGDLMPIEQMIRVHSAGIIESERYLAREAFAAGPPAQQLTKLTAENSADAVTFNRIFNSFNGVSGPVAKEIERAFDATLGQIFGPGVASKMVRGANQAMFTLTLGALDVGFATLNLITPLQTAWPEMAYLTRVPVEAIQKYYSTALVKMPKGGFRTIRFQDNWKFAREAMADVWRPDKETAEAFQFAFEHGAVGRDFVETVHGPLRAMSEGQGGIWDGLQRASEFMVVASEEASRAYSFALGRRIGKDFFRMSEEEARIFGQQFVNNTMYGYSAADRPRMLTGALGAGWGLFKNWTSNYVGNLSRYTAEASRGNFAPLMWSMGTTGAVGGLAAIPAAGMADSFSRLVADKPLSDLVYDWVGNDPGDNSKPWMADMMMHGFFSNLGFTLRSRASVPTSHLATDLSMFTSISILDRAQSALSAMGTALEDSLDLELPLNNPKFRREMLRAFAPRTLQRAMTTFGEQGVTSLRTGNSLLPALNLFEGTLRSVGLTPIRVANAFEVHQNKIYDANEKREAIQKLGRRWADAELNGDWQEVARIINDAVWGEAVPIDSVQRSAEARLRKMMQPLTERQFDDAQTRKRLQMRGIY